MPLGEAGMKSCNRCGDFRPFRAGLSYRYFRLYFIFGVITKKTYFIACNVCGQAMLLDKQQVESALVKNPAPFMDRWGLAIFGLGVVTVVAALALA